MDFVDYSDIGFHAFDRSLKQSEIVTRKKEVIDQVLQHYRARAETVLFVGFNPAAIGMQNSSIHFTQISAAAAAEICVKCMLLFCMPMAAGLKPTNSTVSARAR